MDDLSLLDAIDGVYAAALDRFLWPEALQRASALIDASTSLLLVRARDESGWRIVAASGLSESFISSYNSQWSQLDPFLGHDASTFADGLTIRSVSVDEHRASPFGMFFCEAAGFREGLLAATAQHGGVAVLFWRSSADAFGAAEQQRLGYLWPHVVRALTIQSGSWQASQVPSRLWVESLLDLWHVGIIGFSASGRQVYANRAARQLASAGDGLSFSVDGPVASTVAQTRALRKLVRQLADDDARHPEWLRLPRPSGAAAYEAILCRAPVLIPTDSKVTMFVAAPDESIVCDRTALRRLYGLTDLETSVAEYVGKTIPISAIATALDLSVQTTRWYVQQVREKMSAGSRSHLIRLMLCGLTAIDWQPLHPNSSARKK